MYIKRRVFVSLKLSLSPRKAHQHQHRWLLLNYRMVTSTQQRLALPSNGCLYQATVAFTQQRLLLPSNDCLNYQRLPE